VIREYLQYETPCRGSPDCYGKCIRPFHNVAVVLTLHKINQPIIRDEITDGTASHITMTTKAERGKCVTIHLNKIIKKCIYMETNDFPDIAFVATFPNMIEKN